jgi:TM2 domain-containing membrane protein YozV
MNQKIWVISDDNWEKSQAKSRTFDNQKRGNPQEKIRPENRPFPSAPQKCPALSFSFSMFIWGSGQMYVRDYRSGSKFLAAMLFFYSGLCSLVFFRSSASRFVSEMDIPLFACIIGLVVSFIAGLVVWLCNAIDAYNRTTKSNAEPFRGVGNGIWPPLGSLLFPGWGQFLNGQPGKGFVFLLFGLGGVTSAFVLVITQNVWPVLQTSHDRLILEFYLAAAFAAIPLSFLMWIVSIYDACGPGRKLSRIKPGLPYAGYKVRRQGIVQDLVPRGTVVLGLFLAISVGMQFIPKRYYLDSMENIRHEMLRNNMEIVPELLGKAIVFVDRE